MKKIAISLLVLLTFVITAEVKAGDKFFHAFGTSVYTDYAASPVYKYTYNDPNSSLGVQTYYGQTKSLSAFTLIYEMRYNLYELSDNFAISLNATPALGVLAFALTGSNGGYCSVNVPLMVGAEMGAGSTYNSSANVGGFISAGIEYNKNPLILLDAPMYTSEIPTSWIQPVVATGLRYWNSRNKLREINLKYGFGNAGEPVASTSSLYGSGPFISSAPMTIRLSWLFWINY